MIDFSFSSNSLVMYNSISSFTPPPHSCLTMRYAGGTIVLGKEGISWSGYENANEATLAFLNCLKEVYPSWRLNVNDN